MPLWGKKFDYELDCFGRPVYRIFFDLITSFLNKMNNEINFKLPYFLYNHCSHYTHDFIHVPDSLDVGFKKMIERFEQSNYLDNTLLIILSDHGNRLTRYPVYTPSGRIERHWPFLSMRLPKKLWNTSYFHNAKNNKHKLISAFDIYQTLRHFVHMNTNYEKELDRSQFKINDKSTRHSRGISLFERIPVNRSCADAMVQAQYCPCVERSTLSIKELEKERNVSIGILTNFITNHVNSYTKNLTDRCEKYKFEKIDEIRRFLDDNRFAQYSVLILFQPGDALFEIIISFEKKRSIDDSRYLTVIGNVFRVSKYEGQSYCVNDKLLERYCYCKKKIYLKSK